MSLDEDLLQRIRRQDPSALEQLMTRYQPCVLARVVRIVRDEAAAQDLAQEVFLRVWTRGEQWSAQGSVKAWVLSIGTNLALNYVRSAKLRRWRPLQPVRQTEDEDEPATPAWMLDLAAQNPAEVAELAEQQELLGRLLAELPEDRQQMLQMVFEADLRLSDVADRLGIPTGTAKSRLHYTIRRLTEAWSQLHQEPED
jgi:RNA polymerase sigma factor (sigma-70 family)